jgi:hypothetical protein
MRRDKARGEIGQGDKERGDKARGEIGQGDKERGDKASITPKF